MWEPFDKVADTHLLLHTAAPVRFVVSYSGTGQCVCVSKLDLSRRCGMFVTGFTIRADKCAFNVKEIKYLGHIIDKRGLRPNP